MNPRFFVPNEYPERSERYVVEKGYPARGFGGTKKKKL